MSIELVLRGIDYAIKLLERKEANYVNRFTIIYEPLYNDLKQINLDYTNMFESILLILPTGIGQNRYGERHSLAEACDQLRKIRTAFAGTRNQVAIIAKTYSNRHNLSREEANFLLQVLRYIPTGELKPRDSLGALTKEGSQDTRSTNLLKQLYSTVLMLRDEDAWRLISETISNHNSDWSNVCQAYAALLIKK